MIKIRIETKWFYFSIDRYGFTIALMRENWDLEFHFHFIWYGGL